MMRKILEKYRLVLIWDLLMVAIVLANLGLILFDLTYLSLRPFYSVHIPKLLHLYDKPILGIEPHRVTENYRNQVRELEYLYKLEDPIFRSEELKAKIYLILDKIDKQKVSSSLPQIKSYKEEMIRLSQDEKPDSKSIQKYLNLILDEYDELDKVKEIDELIDLGLELRVISRSFDKDGLPALKVEKWESMDRTMNRIIEDNVFQSSGQIEIFSDLKTVIKDEYSKYRTKRVDRETRNNISKFLNVESESIPTTVVAFSYFWREDPRPFSDKIKFYQEHFDHTLSLNFFRAVDKSGKPINNYIYLDAPFLVFFLLEFIISWYISIRDKEYVAWFLYPVFHWYDVLGLIPIVEFRPFRLVRLYKMYLIYTTNQYTQFIGNDFISNSIRYFTNILKEEISDLVSIQIITETQKDISEGGSVETITKTIDTHRDEIKHVAVKKIQDAVSSDRFEKILDKLIQEITSHMIQTSGMSQFLPQSIQDNLSRSFGIGTYHALKTAIQKTILEDTGRRTVESLIDYAIDEFNETAKDKEFNDLYTSINLELLENVKRSILEKKWVNNQQSPL